MLYIHPHTVFVLEQYYSMLYLFLRVQQEAILGGQFGYLAQRPSESFGLFLLVIAELRKSHPVRNMSNAALFTMAIGLISRAVIDTVSFGEISLEEKARQILEATLGVIFSERTPII